MDAAVLMVSIDTLRSFDGVPSLDAPVDGSEDLRSADCDWVGLGAEWRSGVADGRSCGSTRSSEPTRASFAQVTGREGFTGVARPSLCSGSATREVVAMEH